MSNLGLESKKSNKNQDPNSLSKDKSSKDLLIKKKI